MKSPFKHTNYFLLGLGRSGIATARFLQKSGAKKIVAWDDNVAARTAFAQQLPHVTLEAFTDHVWQQGDVLVLSPGIPHLHPSPHPIAASATKASIPIIVDIELFLQQDLQKKIVGITGTNGKSTTTALLTHVLSATGHDAISGGNIGVATLGLKEKETYILELSSYQLERMTTKALAAAVLLNITEDHLDRHDGIDGYAQAKAHIFDLLKSDGVGIISLDDAHVRKIYETFQQNSHALCPISCTQKLPYGIYMEHGNVVNALDENPYTVLDTSTLQHLQGCHNHQNIMATYAVAKTVFKMSDAEFMKGLGTFKGLPHRQELLGQQHNITCINDSKATNLESAECALQTFSNIYWLVGGRAKESTVNMDLILPHLQNISRAYCFGEARALFANALQDIVPVQEVETLDAAFQAAYLEATNTKKPVTILLSPATSSFDQFKDFEARGNHLRTLWDSAQKTTKE